MEYSNKVVEDLFNRVRLIRSKDKVSFRIDPVPCEHGGQREITFVLPNVDPDCSDTYLMNLVQGGIYSALLNDDIRITALITTDKSEKAVLPRLGERTLLLVLRTKEERANIPGDLAEEFAEVAAKHGARYAKLWYYKQVAASAWPLMRKAVGWGLLASIGAWIRRII